MSGLFCINCFISLKGQIIKKFYLSENEKADKLFRRWTTTILDEIPPEAAVVCKECWRIAIAIPDEDVPDAKPQFGHNSVCVGCGKSCMRKYTKNVWKETISEEESDMLKDIREIISKNIHPRSFNKDSKLCPACYVRAYRKVQTKCPKYKKPKLNAENKVKQVIHDDVIVSHDDVIGSHDDVIGSHDDVIGSHDDVIGSHDDVIGSHNDVSGSNDDVNSEPKPACKPIRYIKLSDYIRASEVHNKCFVEACNIEEAETPPLFMRQSLLKQCNFYIPKTCLVCTKHKTDWDFMTQPMEEIHVFKPVHVAGMLQLLSAKS